MRGEVMPYSDKKGRPEFVRFRIGKASNYYLKRIFHRRLRVYVRLAPVNTTAKINWWLVAADFVSAEKRACYAWNVNTDGNVNNNNRNNNNNLAVCW